MVPGFSGHLIGIEEVLRGRDVDEEIVNEIRNISRLAAATADKALAFVAKRDSRYFIEVIDMGGRDGVVVYGAVLGL